MAIKFKRLKKGHSCATRRGVPTPNGGYETEYYCWEIETPIREWGFAPQQLVIRWAENTPIPTSELVTITFPEIEKSVDLQATNLHYIIKKDAVGGYTFADVIELSSPSGEDLKKLPVKADGKVSFRVRFKNFHLLKEGDNSIVLYLGIMGTDIEGKEHQLEAKNFPIIIKKVAENEVTSPYITTDKLVYNLTYIKSTRQILGDTFVKVNIHNLVNYEADLWFSVENSDFFNHIKEEVKNQSFKNLQITANDEWLNYNEGNFTFETFVFLFRGFFLESYKSDKITINVEIKERPEGFSIDQETFDFELLWSENKTAQGRFVVDNFGGEPLSFEKPDWITLSENNNEISFETLSAQNLRIGRNQGFIKVKSGDFHRNVSVNVVVKKNIENALDEINFCLDKKKILVRKHKAECQFLKAHFVMIFEGYDKPAHTIEQTYEYVFFGNEVTLFPGEEVQDFFPEIPNMEALKINENGFISPQNLFKTCQTEITLSQYDDKGTIHKTEKLPTLYFLPGRKPLAYPYLTNCITRRTYTDSLICLTALQEDFLSKDLGKIAGNLVDVSAITTPKMVVNLSFRRSLADKTFGEKNLIKKEKLELLPITNPQKVIDVLFQNQNICPDWLSFSGEWERHEDFTHTLSENMKNGKTFKAHSEQKTTLKLNTGWLLEEEIPLLNELILSPVCFIKGIEEPGGNNTSQWIRAIAVNKKSLVYDNLLNVRSFVVEFEINN